MKKFLTLALAALIAGAPFVAEAAPRHGKVHTVKGTHAAKAKPGIHKASKAKKAKKQRHVMTHQYR